MILTIISHIDIWVVMPAVPLVSTTLSHHLLECDSVGQTQLGDMRLLTSLGHPGHNTDPGPGHSVQLTS